MKKKNLIIALMSFMLVGCVGGENTTSSEKNSESSNSLESSSSEASSSSENSSSESSSSNETYTLSVDMLEKLSLGYRFDLEIKQTVNGQNQTTYDEVGHNNELYFHKLFLTKEKENAEIFETYSKDADDFLLAERRAASNTKHFLKMYDPTTYEFVKWTDGYQNPFGLITVSDFETKGNNVYALKINQVEEVVKTSLATQLYGNPGLVLSKFEVTINNERVVSLYAECTFEAVDSSYLFEVKGNVVSEGKDVIIEERAKPFEKVQDETFEKMMSNLQNYNYTVNYNGLDSLDNLLEGKVVLENKGIYYELSDGFTSLNGGYLVVNETMLQEVSHVGEDYIKVNVPVEGSLSELYTLMNFDRACFDFVDNKYVLKDDVHDDLGVIYQLETISEALDDFTIEITNDSYIFTNTCYDKNNSITSIETLTFTNVGSTVLPFDETTLKDQEVATSWSQLIDETSSDSTYAQLETKYGELMLALPLVNNHKAVNSWVCLNLEGYDILVSTNEQSNLESDLASLKQDLIDYGFVLDETNSSVFGGTHFTCEPEIDGVVKTVHVEIFIDTQLCIALYI